MKNTRLRAIVAMVNKPLYSKALKRNRRLTSVLLRSDCREQGTLFIKLGRFEEHMRFENIWYATPKRAASRTKWMVFDDVGELEFLDGKMSFRGSKQEFGPIPVTNFLLTRQRMNLVPYAILTAIMAPICIVGAYGLNQAFGIPMLYTGAFLCCGLPIGLLIGLSTKWIRVSFRTTDDEECQAYVADGGLGGWAGIFGGTRRLFNSLKNETAKRQASL